MKKVILVISICIFLMIISSVVIFFSSKTDLYNIAYKNNCCQECLDKANQDPSGYDISIKECFAYKLSNNCEKYFTENNLRVGECS
ncbi:hypothetical protein HYU21_01320 [Candidatus Woesearchaeota archaeon]|nr:hypothetical protein [Candidatus Woesearchaeota archaeon]